MTEEEKQQLQFIRENEDLELQEMRKSSLSKLLDEAQENGRAMRLFTGYLDGDKKLISGEAHPIISQFKENSCNWNSETGNIYDETGRLFITADRELYDKLKLAHGIKRDESIDVELCNGVQLESSYRNNKWREIKDRGMHNSEYYSQKCQEREKLENKEKEEKKALFEKVYQLAQLRGTAPKTPTPVNKTEISQTLMNAKTASLSNNV